MCEAASVIEAHNGDVLEEMDAGGIEPCAGDERACLERLDVLTELIDNVCEDVYR